MVFQEILRNLVESVPGAAASMIMGYDGIPLEQYVKPQGAPFDLQTVGIEYCGILNEIKKNAATLGMQGIQEVSVRAEPWTLVFRLISDEYFAILALGSNAYLGKGRYLLRHAAHDVRAQL